MSDLVEPAVAQNEPAGLWKGGPGAWALNTNEDPPRRLGCLSRVGDHLWRAECDRTCADMPIRPTRDRAGEALVRHWIERHGFEVPA